MRIACCGAGPGGLYFALLARRAGHDVTVFERNAPGLTYGWGVVYWDGLLRTLRSGDARTVDAIRERSFRWCGQTLHVSGRPPVRKPGDGFGIGRRQLLEALGERAAELGVDLRFGHEVRGLAELADADVVVAADGAGSVLRRELADRFAPRVEGGRNRYVWLGTTRVFDTFTFGFARTDAGLIWIHAYAFDPETSTVIVECTPETWAALGLGALGADESLRLLEAIFAEQLEGHRLLVKDDGLQWREFRCVTNERWHAGKAVLLGDAAHTTHFSIGSGMRLAMEDAASLARHVDGGLALYERERRRAIARAQRDARLSARWFEHAERYAGLEPGALFEVLGMRRSRVLPHVSPRAYHRVLQARRLPARTLRAALNPA